MLYFCQFRQFNAIIKESMGGAASQTN